jgi:hypothetical protein
MAGRRSVDKCPTCGRRNRRSNPANARYWLLLHLAASKLKPGGQTYSAEQFHIYYKSRFLGCVDFVLPNGKTLAIPKSSADLDVSEFAEYTQQVETDLADRDVFLEA